MIKIKTQTNIFVLLLVISLLMSACENSNIEKEFYPNGNIKYETEYFHGDIKSKKVYFESGELYWVADYLNGKKNGMLKEYYKNGQLKIEANFVNGKQDGWTRQYYSNGKIESEILFSDGKNNGIAKSYYSNGSLSFDALFKNDTVVLYRKEFNESGVLIEDFYALDIEPLCKDTIGVGDVYKVKISIYGVESGKKVDMVGHVNGVPMAMKKLDVKNGSTVYEFKIPTAGEHLFIASCKIEGREKPINGERKFIVM